MKAVIIAGCVILAVFLFVLYWIPLGIEPLTEVYIENHTDLPKNVYLNKTYNFSFTIHNLEYQDMRYNYSIDVYDANGTLVRELENNDVVLENNESVTITQDYRFDSKFGRAQIKINVVKDDMGIVPGFKKKLWWPDPNYPN